MRRHFRFQDEPLKLAKILWPHVNLYDKQRDIVMSVWGNSRTYVVAANGMGKDFIAGMIVILYFLTREPCKIITTSAGGDHLGVLWAEINRFIQTSAVPLTAGEGGEIVVKDLCLEMGGSLANPMSYVWGLVAAQDRIAKMQGHHANPMTAEEANDGVPRNLFIADEASSVPQSYFDMADGWAKRQFIFGNAWPCNNDFIYAFKGSPDRTVKGGDIPDPLFPQRYLRKTFQIRAVDSPNIQWALRQASEGVKPTGEILIAGVKDWTKYQEDLALFNEPNKKVKLEAEWYEGRENKMYPREWLDRAERRALQVAEVKGLKRVAKGVGVDPAEGGDSTAICVVDEHGVIELTACKTPNTAVIRHMVKEVIRRHGIESEKVCIDRGGGGKQIADQLREEGYEVNTVSFGEGIVLKPVRRKHPVYDRQEQHEERYTYKNRRSQMYGRLREMLDPEGDPVMSGRATFSFGREHYALRNELAPIPLDYGKEGEMILPPKNKPSKDYKGVTLVDLIGHSPDLADACVLAVHAMNMEPEFVAGVY